MARPRKDEAGPSAYERMTAAFWSLLEEKPYSAVTVKRITQRAGVNHNTFYYHFENIDDMAVKMFENVIPTRLIDMMAAVSMGKPPDLSVVRNDPEIGGALPEDSRHRAKRFVRLESNEQKPPYALLVGARRS